jgi:hypothetical protein
MDHYPSPHLFHLIMNQFEKFHQIVIINLIYNYVLLDPIIHNYPRNYF